MLKFWIGGAIVTTAIAAVAIGGYEYAQSQALGRVEAEFASLRSGGVAATHGAVDLDLWNRGVVIHDVAVKSAGDQPVDVTVKQMAFDSVDIWAKDLVAKQVALSDVAIRNLTGASGPAQASMVVPRVVLADVRALAVPLDQADAKSLVQQAAAQFAAISATSVTVPTITLSMPMPAMPRPSSPSVVPGTVVNLDYVYANLKLENLHDGRVDRLTSDGTKINAAAGAPIVGGTVGATTASDIDFLPYFGLGLARRTARDGYYPTHGAGSLGAYNLQLANGGLFELGGATFGAGGVDPAKFSIARMQEMMATITTLGPTPDPARMQAFSTLMGDIYEGLTLGKIEATGLHIAGPSNGPPIDIRVDTFAMGPLVKGKLQEMRVSGIAGSTTPSGGRPTPFRLGTMALRGFDVARIMRIAGSAPGNGQPLPPEKAAAVFAALEGFEIAGLSMPAPPTGQIVQIDTFNAGWGQFVDVIPSNVHWTFKGALPLDPADPNSALLRHFGIPRLVLANDTSVNWIEADRRLEGKLDTSVGQLGALTASVSLGNVPREAFRPVPGQFQSLAPGFEIGPLALTLRDQGAVKILDTVLAQANPPGADPAAPKPDPVDTLRLMLVDPAHPDGSMTTLLDGISRFLATPGQTIALKIAPKAPLALAELTAPGALQAPGALAALLDRFTVDVQVTP